MNLAKSEVSKRSDANLAANSMKMKFELNFGILFLRNVRLVIMSRTITFPRVLTHFLHIKIQAKLTNFTFYLISPQVFTAVCKAIPHLKDE